MTAKYNYLAQSYGGSNPAGSEVVDCNTGFVAVGKMCLQFPLGDEQVFAKAAVSCSDKGSIIYSPLDQTQNAIMAAMLDKWV